MNSCHLVVFPRIAINRFVNLTHLYLRNNSLTDLPAGAFSQISKLQKIDLSDNPLISLDDNIFKGLENSLQSVHINNAGLRYFQVNAFSNLRNLQGIRMDDNQIETLSNDMFTSFQTHSKNFVLSLGHNQIRSINLTTFAVSNISLSYLCLEDNQLKNLLFLSDPCNSSFGAMTSIDVKHNPIDCDCLTYRIVSSDNYYFSGDCSDEGSYAGYSFDIGTVPSFTSAVAEQCSNEPPILACITSNSALTIRGYTHSLILVILISIKCICHS